MNPSFKHICGTEAVYFETSKHAGLEYNFLEGKLEQTKCTSEATDILIGFERNELSECLLIERTTLVQYVKSMLMHGLYPSKSKSGGTLVWLPLDLAKQMAWRMLDMHKFWPLYSMLVLTKI